MSLFGLRQPLHAPNVLAHAEEDVDAEQHRRNAFDEDQPLPAAHAAEARHEAQDRPGDEPTDHARRRQRDIEHAPRAAAPRGGIPLAHVVDRARDEARFGQPEQKAHHVELRGRADEDRRAGEQAPRHHDARDPAARAHLVQDHVARHFEQEIAEKEDARAEAVDGIAELQVARHLQLGEADVDAIEVGKEKAEHQDRQDAHGYFPEEGVFVDGLHACLHDVLCVDAVSVDAVETLRRAGEELAQIGFSGFRDGGEHVGDDRR